MRKRAPRNGPDIRRALDIPSTSPTSLGPHIHRAVDELAHHSLADWDDCHGNARLCTERYISPPSSLARDAEPYSDVMVTCKFPGTINLPEGRIVSWGYGWTSAAQMFVIRAQGDPPCLHNLEGYWLRFAYNTNVQAECRHYTNAEFENYGLGTFDFRLVKGEWSHLRFTWWNGLTPGCAEAICIKLEVEENGEWLDKGTLYDTNNYWKDAPTNRITYFTNEWRGSIDDTEIWGPA